MIDEAVYNLLTANAGDGVTVVPTTDIVTRGLPKLFYTRLSTPRLYTDSGAVGIVSSRFQLDVYAQDPRAAYLIADRIRIALDGYKGTSAGVPILRISFPEGSRSDVADAAPGANARIARETLDMIVTVHEPMTLNT